jgi:exosortase E/protease (VPEID-CTERM system)
MNLARPCGLIVTLLFEIIWLTVRFDTGSLQHSSFWAELIGWSPQFLRFAISALAVILLVSHREIRSAIRNYDPASEHRSSLAYIVGHLFAFVVFVWLTHLVVESNFRSFSHPIWGFLSWFFAGGVTLVLWGLAMWPAGKWRIVLDRGRIGIACGSVAGAVVWAAGFVSEDLWRPFGGYTFRAVRWILSLMHVSTVADPVRLTISSGTFTVSIAPQCSGYEGIGLITAFLAVYLLHFRKELRFPNALLLIPIGATAIWILNLLRIAALVMIGISGWPDIAQGGFHSQAGWIAFNTVGLTLVAVTSRCRSIRSFMMVTKHDASSVDEPNPTTAYLAPFLAIVATAMITGALSASFEWLYPLRVVAGGITFWAFRKTYEDLKWRLSWFAILLGIVVAAIWVGLSPVAAHASDGWPAALHRIPLGWAAVWLAIRLAGYAITVPLAEELAFRGFLIRRLMRPDFHRLPIGAFSWHSFLISAVLFGVLHGKQWFAATIAGVLFALALYHRRRLGDAVQAHAIANGLIAIYAFATGQWWVWS